MAEVRVVRALVFDEYRLSSGVAGDPPNCSTDFRALQLLGMIAFDNRSM